ncbi:MAG TPA: Holliday junction resolvase RuvX [Candidatus Dormibacteraeota bacterium]|nr:Holliday junction resolvase RuvX [Candidatus Dormibacteraeota bacterium]
MGRIFAVDLGSRRVGLAVSDPTQTIATALSTEPAEPEGDLADRIAVIATEHEAERIVVGLPRELDGTRGPAAAGAERLASRLRSVSGVPVETFDERLTTAAAERSLIEAGVRRKARRQAIDRVAATVLLQGYLDRRRSTRRAG